ncbi:MAG TPA: hypothetical protein PLX54_00850 [Candidatus Fermentibacter daniensis]|nr:hypothetical protein [Candidatus Fermentibacter daniensis]HOR06675.1 hypothetical protein [Candidatus Fermentibacter daniensis]HPK50904.1 hypothetical protein [Candidatus Fermentibacter daniensis]
MAHRTRKRLTKTELKRDPVAENLATAWNFLRSHIKETAIGCVVLLALILVIQSVIQSSRRQNAESMARYILAETLFEQAEQLSAAGNMDQAAAALNQAYMVAGEVYSRNQNRDWGRRSAILAAKAGILLGRDNEVIQTMQSLLSSRPDAMTKASALLHLGVALENRGGEQDLLNARNSYSTVAGDSVKYPIMAAEALAGLSRISMADGDVETARDLLVRSIEMRGDTTEFDEYQLARMDWME